MRDRPSPFAVVTGASAVAINGAALAARIDEIEEFVRNAEPLAPAAAHRPRRLRAIGANAEG